MTIARYITQEIIEVGSEKAKQVEGWGLRTKEVVTYADHCREMEEAVKAERERCAKILENGSFLSNESLEAKWAKQVAALIRQEPLAANKKDQCSVSFPHPGHDWCKGTPLKDAANRKEEG